LGQGDCIVVAWFTHGFGSEPLFDISRARLFVNYKIIVHLEQATSYRME
jgi:hypothetical protein